MCNEDDEGGKEICKAGPSLRLESDRCRREGNRESEEGRRQRQEGRNCSPFWPRVADGALTNASTRLGNKMPDYLLRRLNPNPPNTITSRTMTTMIHSMRCIYPEEAVPIVHLRDVTEAPLSLAVDACIGSREAIVQTSSDAEFLPPGSAGSHCVSEATTAMPSTMIATPSTSPDPPARLRGKQ
jgi:hypothetical protein